MHQPVRVGIDVTPLIGPPTGIHQHTRHLTSALLDRDDVAVSGWVLSWKGKPPPFEGPIRRSPLPARAINWAWRRGSWPSRRALAGPVDVIHGTNFLGPPAPTTVLTVQDMTPFAGVGQVDPVIARKAPAILHAIAEGAWAHVSSQLVGDELRSRTGSDRIRVIHHGLAPAREIAADLGHQLAGRQRYLVVIGSTDRRKRVEAVVDALPQLPTDIGLVVAGPPGDAEAAVAAAIERHGLENRVRRILAVSNGERDALIRDAVALVLASRYEGFAFTPLEAIRMGTPVLATAVGVLPELVGDLIELIQPEADLIEPLLRVCEDAEMPAAARVRVKSLTWERAAEEMVDLYLLAAQG